MTPLMKKKMAGGKNNDTGSSWESKLVQQQNYKILSSCHREMPVTVASPVPPTDFLGTAFHSHISFALSMEIHIKRNLKTHAWKSKR